MTGGQGAGRRAARIAVGILVALVLVAVVALALVQRFHLYPGLARLWG